VVVESRPNKAFGDRAYDAEAKIRQGIAKTWHQNRFRRKNETPIIGSAGKISFVWLKECLLGYSIFADYEFDTKNVMIYIRLPNHRMLAHLLETGLRGFVRAPKYTLAKKIISKLFCTSLSG